MTTYSSVVGTDGIRPVHEPDSVWKIWSLDDVYMGLIGDKKYVPKLNDYVVDISINKTYRVAELSAALIPTLVPVVTNDTSGEFTDDDLLLSDAPGSAAETFRIFIDKSTMPHSLTVDARCYVRGSMASYAKLFKGSRLTNDEEVISAFYDANLTLLGQNIPLELAEINNVTNKTTRTVMPCYTSKDLADSELVTVVFYSDSHAVISRQQLVVENTGFIRTTDASQKYITHIALETPFMSEADSTLIRYPVNVPLAGFNMFGVVYYSDGTKRRLPVDGSKFDIFGLENYVATVVDQELKITLVYNLSPGEVAYGVSVSDGKFITKHYRAITENADGNYSVKLFGYPVWVDGVNGYRIQWFMFNLDRQQYYDVTNHVRLSNNSAPFRPTAYGALQRLQYEVNLKAVNGIYKDYNFTQTIEILLRRPGDEAAPTRWAIGFEPGQNPLYGVENRAEVTHVNANLKRVKIDQGEASLTDWLERMFYLTKPLADPDREGKAPEPNMFSIVVGSAEYEFTINQWNQSLTINSLLSEFENINVKFFKRTVENDLLLGMSAISQYRT